MTACKPIIPLLAMLLFGCSQSLPVIQGLCNHYGGSDLVKVVQEATKATLTRSCSARPDSNCTTGADGKNSEIPEAESQADLDASKRWLVDGNNGRTFCIWRMTKDKMIRGADSCNFSKRVDMAESNPSDFWYVVLDERFHVALSLNSCTGLGQPLSFHCSAQTVKGYWHYRYTIPTDSTETWKHGTTKKYDYSKTEEWSQSISFKVETSLKVEGFGSGGVSVGPTIGHKFAEDYGQEWSVNQEYDITVHWPAEDIGKASWQFVVDMKDSCDHKERALLREFAVTPNREREPCCLPGYGVDMPYYTQCLSKEYLMPNAEKHGCTADSRTQEVIQVV